MYLVKERIKGEDWEIFKKECLCLKIAVLSFWNLHLFLKGNIMENKIFQFGQTLSQQLTTYKT